MTWLGLGYNIPANPSKNRVYVWRKLKEFGATYFKQGVAILPNNAQSMAKFSSLAARIRDMGGEATVIELRFVNERDELETIERFRRQSEEEYRELLRDCAELMAAVRGGRTIPPERTDHMRKMVKRYSKVKSRDYFRSRSRGELAGALEELAGDMARVTDDLGHQLRNMLDL